MTIEWKDQFGGKGEVDYSEHSHPSRAKKVIQGPLTLAKDPEDVTKSIDPIQGTVGASSASLTLLRNKAYRVIASVDTYIRLSEGASTAVAGDVYLPANSAIVVDTKDWDTLSFIRVATGGIIQAVEVL
jgi:hypothetical protein